LIASENKFQLTFFLFPIQSMDHLPNRSANEPFFVVSGIRGVDRKDAHQKHQHELARNCCALKEKHLHLGSGWAFDCVICLACTTVNPLVVAILHRGPHFKML
jgi:hypothetical protein